MAVCRLCCAQLVSAGNSIMVGGVMTAFKKASSAVVHKKATVGARPTDAQLDTVFKLLDKSEDGWRGLTSLDST
jgi:hypothetical protein